MKPFIFDLPIVPLIVLFVVLAGSGLSSCSPIGMAAGAGATLGIASAKEGGISGAATDLRIKTLISEKWFSYKVDTFRKLSLTVDQGRVLITGIVQNPDDRVEAVRLAWQVSGVKQVINEIRVADGEGVGGYLKDTWISARLRTAMTFDKNIQAINYSIDTVNGTVYLMGVARSQKDLDNTVALARTIPGVKQVVTYVKPAGQPVQSGMVPSGVPERTPQQQNNPDAPATGQPATGAPVPVHKNDGYGPYAASGLQSGDPYAAAAPAGDPSYMTPSPASYDTYKGGGLGVAPVTATPLPAPGR